MKNSKGAFWFVIYKLVIYCLAFYGMYKLFS